MRHRERQIHSTADDLCPGPLADAPPNFPISTRTERCLWTTPSQLLARSSSISRRHYQTISVFGSCSAVACLRNGINKSPSYSWPILGSSRYVTRGSIHRSSTDRVYRAKLRKACVILRIKKVDLMLFARGRAASWLQMSARSESSQANCTARSRSRILPEHWSTLH